MLRACSHLFDFFTDPLGYILGADDNIALIDDGLTCRLHVTLGINKG